MRLLVSVRDAHEAHSALDGGADLIDAKDPLMGALGPVSLEELERICTAVSGRRSVSAALGDAMDEPGVRRTSQTYASRGATFVKIGFSGIRDRRVVAQLIRAAVNGAQASGSRCGVVAVAYADAQPTTIAPEAVVDAAAEAGAIGVLLDTTDKDGPGLRQVMTARALHEWASDAHDAGLLVAIAGRLTSADLPFVRDAGADIAGVRGAACEGGRGGSVVADKVRLLRDRLSHRR